MENKNNKIHELSTLILKCKKDYYNSGSSELDDIAYDALEEKLRALAPAHPVLSMVGSSFDESVPKFKKAKHETKMLSLDKTRDVSELKVWRSGKEIFGSWKIDGNSLSLVYSGGVLVQSKTRGNGTIGQDVTRKTLFVSEVLKNLSVDTCEIRGEIVCKKENFKKLSKKMVSMGLEEPTNPRNIVAGVMGRSDYDELTSFFSFYAFDILDGVNRTEVEKFEELKSLGFEVPKNKLIRNDDELDDFLNVVEKDISEADIMIDGAVFSMNKPSDQKAMGYASKYPKFKLAFKWNGETVISTLLNINWFVSKHGIVTPVAVIEPVELTGAMITNITLYNASTVKAYDLAIGDEIEIIRSGDVIPKFLEIAGKGEGVCSLPSNCPSCNSLLIYDDVRLRCANKENCSAQNEKLILSWIKAVNIENLSEKRIELLNEAGLLTSIPDLYDLTVDSLKTVDGIQDKIAQSLYGLIQKSKVELTLVQFLKGIGIENIGTTIFDKITDRYRTLDEVMALTNAQILAFDGIQKTTADAVYFGLRSKKDIINTLISKGVIPPQKALEVKNVSNSSFAGKSFVITGKLNNVRSHYEKILDGLGAVNADSVNKNTNYLVCSDYESSDSSKAKRAKDLIAKGADIKILSEDELIAILTT